MITEIEYLGGGPVTFGSFCDRHGLKIVVKERSLTTFRRDLRFYASLSSKQDQLVEVMDRGLLIGVHGNGPIIEDAIEDLTGNLRGKRLAIGAYGASRQEIQVPNEWKII